jgi:hypothetical protein
MRLALESYIDTRNQGLPPENLLPGAPASHRPSTGPDVAMNKPDAAGSLFGAFDSAC